MSRETIDFLLKILAINSTTGKEDALADYLFAQQILPGAAIETQPVPEGGKNLFFKMGVPKIIFCTHLDTVPPYFAPRFDAATQTIFGRGSIDAKGQIAVMVETCRLLAKAGANDFGLLLLVGEETGSSGAAVANEKIKGCQYVIVGEPTENKLITAGKGTCLVEVKVTGKAAHSGYPEEGDNAVSRALNFLQKVATIDFAVDPLLGETTYNIGAFAANNAFNVIADLVTFKLFFRTTFASAAQIKPKLLAFIDDKITLDFKFGRAPIKFHNLSGFENGVVAFGSDAQRLAKLGKPLLYGPGTIRLAHTLEEKITVAELAQAVLALQKIYEELVKSEVS